MSQMLQPFAFAEPRSVNIADLETELSGLWRSAAQDPETQLAVTRACALTLLVYVENEKAGQEVRELIAKVTRQHPCRAVTIIAEPEASPAGLSAQIAAQCHLPAAGEKEVCCELVTVMARGDAVRGLDQVVIPLMVAGLPVTLWWRAGRFAQPSYLHWILRFADRVFVDSARFPNPEADLRSFYHEIQRVSAKLVFTDLAWARITRWRELVAQCFDSPEARPYLDQLTELRIEYERESPRILAHRAQALLLTAWLASRLNWEAVVDRSRPAGEEGYSVLFRSSNGPVKALFRPRRFEGGSAGLCVSITMKAGGASPATFSLARGCDGKTVRTRAEIPGRPPTERAVLLPVLDEVDLVNEEIKFAERDRLYEEALAMVARMMGD